MIPFFDARAGYLALQPALDAAVQRVLRSGILILGPEVAAFEQEFAAFVGAPHAVGVASGTDAITLALRALGVGPGDEVVTVANAGVPTVAAIRAALATPRFVDVQPGSLLMDPGRLPAVVNAHTRCIVPVHLYGQVAALEPIRAFARHHGLTVVEDCAHAHGARLHGQHVGTLGDVGCFSFYPTKNLGAFGDGGMCVTNRPEIAERLRMLRTYGFHGGDEHARVEGVNSRLDELQAAMLRVKLAQLPAALAARRRLARVYDAGLSAAYRRLPPETAGAEYAPHLYVIQSSERSRIVERLRQAEVGWRIHYPVPVHTMAAYAFLGYQAGDLPMTERAADTVLSLPLYPELSEAAVHQVIAVLGAPPQ